MELQKKKNIKIPTPAFFVLAIVAIMSFFPREGKFKYTYTEGRPWKYGLLTTSFDFPIYKPEAQVESEKDSVMKSYQPYYILDKSVAEKAISQFEKDATAKSVPQNYITFVKKELSELYKAGIISANDYEQVDGTYLKQLQLRDKDDNMNNSRQIASLYTSKLAYEKLIGDIPEALQTSVLQSLNINNYLYDNVIFDGETSQKAKADLLLQVSFAQGMIQSGERIIDKGEIVDTKIYNILNSLKKVTEERIGTNSEQGWHILGGTILVTALIASFLVYLRFFRAREYYDRKNIFFMLLMISFFCIITGISVDYKLFNIYIIPFAIPTILIRTFIDSRTAMTTHLITILICALMVPFPVEFMIIQIPIGFMCIFSLKDLSERSQLIRSSFFILIAYNIMYVAFTLCQEGDISHINWRMFLYFGINFILVMFSYLLVYMCEKVFGFISGVSLVELSNINKPLLLKLSEVAPGTFQHSIQVSNLATAAASKIGANASLVRTGALYHDIGKILNPAFFTENQSPGMNPHLNLSRKESAQIIIEHVAEGVKIAEKYNLPKQITDFIQTHHGRSLVKFFYNSYVNEHPNEVVDESEFRYPGPNPFSKETAILMMADCVEAASHSLPEYTEETIVGLVERIINTQMSEGLLKNAPITFSDIEVVKEIFFEKLKAIYHTRIAYPEIMEPKEEDGSPNSGFML